MSQRGLCSRREADALIEQGKVLVNGVVVTELGTKVLEDVEIEIKGQQNLQTILLNKPLGYVSAQPEPGYEPAVRLLTVENQWSESPHKGTIRSFQKLAVAGRLDINSTGLLVFTQDGRIAKQLLSGIVEKEYLVRVRGHLPEENLQKLRHGLELDGKPLKPAKIEWINEDQLRFTLTEGKKRQIRRMCELVGLQVLALKRVRIGHVRLGKLPEGQWRILADDESF